MRKVITKLSALTAAAVLTMSLAGCSANITGVTLPLPATMERGTTMTATPEYAFDGATPETAALEKKLDALGMQYSSSNPDVIAVDENGNLTALGIGTAEVAMQSKDGTIADSKTMEVVVTPTAMEMADSLTLTENTTAQLDVAVTPDDATHVAVAYATSDESIAAVNADGEVEAKAAGEATVTAAVIGTELSRTCRVTVLPAVQEVTLSDSELSLQKGGTASLTYGILPETAVDTGAVYTSADESIATVAEDGTVTAVADGKTTVTVTVDGVSADCAVTVYTPAPKASTTSGSGNTSSGAAAGSADQGSSQSSTAAASGFEYGAIPFSAASDDMWWSIDQSDSVYWAVLDNINAMRAAAGVPPLSANSGLDAIAHSRCEYQLVNNVFSHDGAQTPEILAQSQKSASEVCYAWQTSPSHYAVITNPNFTQIGISCWFEIGGSTIWCCTFG